MANANKTDDREEALAGKVALRVWLASQFPQKPRVLEVFCGVAAAMWALAWRDHSSAYTGIDQAKSFIEERPDVRVGDALDVLATLDLGKYDIVDVDAWGTPWRVVRAVAGRRALAAGERFGLLTTDGSGLNVRFKGAADDSTRWFMRGFPAPRMTEALVPITVSGLRATARAMGARLVAMRRVTSLVGRRKKGPGANNVPMFYAAALLEGRAT